MESRIELAIISVCRKEKRKKLAILTALDASMQNKDVLNMAESEKHNFHFITYCITLKHEKCSLFKAICAYGGHRSTM